MCAYVRYICESVQATDRFLQAFISPNLREKQLLLRLCIPTTMCKRNVKCKQLPLANTVPVSICLLSFLFFNLLFLFLPLLFFCLSSSVSLPLLLPDAAQLYQQYSEAAQNFEILRQARSDVISLSEDAAPSPVPSPPPARRPLPPLPPVPHPHSLSHTGSITSVKSLPLPEPPKSEGRPSSPRLSICLTQSATLWRELPGVRNSSELEELTEDQRRLQEVTHGLTAHVKVLSPFDGRKFFIQLYKEFCLLTSLNLIQPVTFL